MTSRDVIARLQREGWQLRSVRGSHNTYKHPETGKLVTVPHQGFTFGYPESNLQAGWLDVSMRAISVYYPVVIHKDPNTVFGVIVPDLPGCFSAGDSIEDALSQAEDAVLCHLEAMKLDAAAVPLPRSVEHHLQDHPEWREGIWALVKIQPDLALTPQS